MPQYKTVDTDAMLKAAESGQEGVRQAENRRQQESQFTREHTLRATGQATAEFQQQQQINEQVRANKSREELQGKELSETARRNRMQEAIEQDKQDIEIADKELAVTGQSRADKLTQGEAETKKNNTPFKEISNAEMEQSMDQAFKQQEEKDRFNQQADQPLEVADPNKRTLAPTELRQQREQSKTVTNRMNAQANYLNAVRNFSDAKLKGDEDSMKAETKSLQQPIKEAARLFDLGKKRELQPNQWEDIKALASDVPDQALQQEIASKQFGPALSRFLQARVSQSAIQFMAVTGDMPDGELVDLASPAMREFTTAAEQMQNYLRDADAGGLLSQSLGIKSLADRNKLIRKLTAQAMLNDKATPKPTGGSLIPSQGGKAMNPQGGQNGPARVNPGSRSEGAPGPAPGQGPASLPLPKSNPWQGNK